MMTRWKDRRDHRGAAAVELALLLPFFLPSVLVMLDLGRALRCAAAVSECARSGAMAAIDPDVSDEALGNAIQSAGNAAPSELGPDSTHLAAPPTITYILATDNAGFTYVEVTASTTYRSLFAGGLSGLNSTPIVRTVRMMRHTPPEG